MTEPAAFSATYSDWKLIRSRGVVQLVFEVPVEAAGEAYDVLGGMPDQAKSVWCAVARLQPPQQEAAKPQPAVLPHILQSQAGATGKSYAQRIAMLCQAPAFRAFLRENNILCDGHSVVSTDDAAQAIRQYCEVASRSEICAGTAAGHRWLLLDSARLAWQEAPRVGA